MLCMSHCRNCEPKSHTVDSPPDHTLDNAEREHILRILRETGGVLSGPDGAARRLGLKRTTLQSKMQRLKIKRQDYYRVPNGVAQPALIGTLPKFRRSPASRPPLFCFGTRSKQGSFPPFPSLPLYGTLRAQSLMHSASGRSRFSVLRLARDGPVSSSEMILRRTRPVLWSQRSVTHQQIATLRLRPLRVAFLAPRRPFQTASCPRER